MLACSNEQHSSVVVLLSQGHQLGARSCDCRKLAENLNGHTAWPNIVQLLNS
jgi:hypothetical protein